MPQKTLTSSLRARFLRAYRLVSPEAGELVFAWFGHCMPQLFDCAGPDDEHCGDRTYTAIAKDAPCLILYVQQRQDNDGNHKLVVLTPTGTGWAWSSAFKRA